MGNRGLRLIKVNIYETQKFVIKGGIPSAIAISDWSILQVYLPFLFYKTALSLYKLLTWVGST